jgi:hypothetical protein
LCLTLKEVLRTLAALRSAPPCACFSGTFEKNFLARARNEAYLPTEQSASSAHSRLSRPHGHTSGSSGPRPAPRERSQASHCLSRCARSAPPAPVRLVVSWARLLHGRSNPRNASDKNPNSIVCIVTRAARPTPASRYLRETPARPFPALDWRLPPASWGMRCAAIASSVWSGNRFASINMSCPQWISSSMRAPVRAMRTTLQSRAVSSGIGER